MLRLTAGPRRVLIDRLPELASRGGGGLTFFFVVMGGILLMVWTVILLDWYGRRKDGKSGQRAAWRREAKPFQ